jgi:hypothetical protein
VFDDTSGTLDASVGAGTGAGNGRHSPVGQDDRTAPAPADDER